MKKGRGLREFRLWLALAAILASAPAAAIELSVIGPDSAVVEVGEAFTIDVAFDNASLTPTQGVTATLTGMSAAGAIVTGGQAAVNHLAALCLPTACFGGIVANNAFFNPNDLSMSAFYTPGDDSIVILSALGFQPTSSSGALDPGLDGALDEPSARDMTIHLIAQTVGIHVFTIGGTFASDSGPQPITHGATFTLTVIPEPGTGLLVGLGLQGLAWAGRRSRPGLEPTGPCRHPAPDPI